MSLSIMKCFLFSYVTSGLPCREGMTECVAEGECNSMSVLTADIDVFTLSLMIKEDYKELEANMNLL